MKTVPRWYSTSALKRDTMSEEYTELKMDGGSSPPAISTIGDLSKFSQSMRDFYS
jgi:hypothetical protein